MSIWTIRASFQKRFSGKLDIEGKEIRMEISSNYFYLIWLGVVKSRMSFGTSESRKTMLDWI